MTELVSLARYYDREEALVAKAALDSAGLFVVLNGVDTLVGMPELRGAAPLTLYGLAPECADAVALLGWRSGEAPTSREPTFLRAPLKDGLWVALTLLMGLAAGVPYMIRWPRREELT